MKWLHGFCSSDILGNQNLNCGIAKVQFANEAKGGPPHATKKCRHLRTGGDIFISALSISPGYLPAANTGLTVGATISSCASVFVRAIQKIIKP